MKILVFTCCSSSLHGSRLIPDFIKNHFQEESYILVTRAGGIRDLISPDYPQYKDSVLRDISTPLKLGQVDKIVILGHQDCRPLSFCHQKNKSDWQIKMLSKAQAILEGELEFPVEAFFASKKEDSDELEIKKMP